MPLYEYHCSECDWQFEKIQGIEDPLPRCPRCGGEVERILFPSSIHYKGSGFYSTDNKADERVRGESGKLGRKVSQTDSSNIMEDTPTKYDTKGRSPPKDKRPKPARSGT